MAKVLMGSSVGCRVAADGAPGAGMLAVGRDRGILALTLSKPPTASPGEVPWEKAVHVSLQRTP